MAVFRVEKNKGYTVMSNHHLRNKELSLKAKGLLSQMLSLPEDWDYTLAGLSLINRESIDAIRTAVWEQENALIPADLETGETIKTPRGTFYVTAMSREQMEAAGYGLHHQSDDGKYLIMGNGTRAFAVPVQPENYLKAAEQTTEQNYNMIDGQINNTPTTAELEAKVKAGETISLVDLAEAVKADKERGKAAKTEKKPSIRAQLRADKEKTAQKKAAKSKNHELEV